MVVKVMDNEQRLGQPNKCHNCKIETNADNVSADIHFLQGQKDLPTAFDKQDKDQFVADCKEVSICCCCSFLLLLLMLIISLRSIIFVFVFSP